MIYAKPRICLVNIATGVIAGQIILAKVGVVADGLNVFCPFFHVTAAAYEADE